MDKERLGKTVPLVAIILLLFCILILFSIVRRQNSAIQQLAIMSPDEVGIYYITTEEIVSAKFDSSNPNYIYTINDYRIVEELLSSLDNAVFQKCDKPKDIMGLEMIYISTCENEYAIGVVGGIFRISVNGEDSYYRCSKKADFIEKLCELQGR